MSACTNHPDRTTDRTCAGCSRPFCTDCLLPFEKLFLCASCKQRFLGGDSTEAAPRRGDAARASRPRTAKRGTWVHWAVGIAALLFVLAFGFVVGNRLTAPLLAERRAQRLDGALTDLSKVGAALEHYRVKNGSFPESLDGLVPDFLPELPDDPYGKGPPVYRRKKETVLLYSRGPDKKDDQGIPYDPASQKGDLLYPLQTR